MKANPAALTKFLDSSQQFFIPIYQRSYSWTEHQCDQLWNDIVRVAQDEKTPAHFIGSIVYIEKDIYQASDITKLQVIDGQQRLTTFSLLLAALGRALQENPDGKHEITKGKIDKYLFNREEEPGPSYYKLALRREDNEAFKDVLDEKKDVAVGRSPNIVNNYKFFQEKISKDGIDLDLLYAGIKKLIIVDVSLESGKDNPQLIFESLNSTGLDLSQADLIRNYILMGLEEKKQERLYEEYWRPIERAFRHAENSNYFDRFMRDYLTIKTGQIPNMDEVYQAFKEHCRPGQPIDDVISDIHYYAMYFAKLSFAQEPDPELNRHIRNINALKVNVAYPFLLDVYADHDKGVISDDDMLEIFAMVESYVFRRSMCDIATNSLNKTFGHLAGELDKNEYLQSLKAVLCLKGGYRRFPTDMEFEEGFLRKDVYRTLHIRRHLLERLENHHHKERVNIDNYTIEHIMPQTLSKEWKDALGPDWERIHEKYLHTAGNLTLTGYNPELSNKQFLEKRDMEGGFAHSHLSLNDDLRELDHWNEATILARGRLMLKKSVQIWKYPHLPPAILEKYRTTEEEEEEEEDDSPRIRWFDNLERASDKTRRAVDSLMSQIRGKFDCVEEPYSWWLAFYIKRPVGRKTMFALLDCGRRTANVIFRVNPDIFEGGDDVRKVAGWFFPRNTERRISLTEGNIPYILSLLEHAYDATQDLNRI